MDLFLPVFGLQKQVVIGMSRVMPTGVKLNMNSVVEESGGCAHLCWNPSGF